MLLLRTDALPSGAQWLYELKLDGYRAIAFKRKGALHLRSRNDNDFNTRYPAVVEALGKLPDDTVIDGEVVELRLGAAASGLRSRDCCDVPARSTLRRRLFSGGAE